MPPIFRSSTWLPDPTDFVVKLPSVWFHVWCVHFVIILLVGFRSFFNLPLLFLFAISIYYIVSHLNQPVFPNFFSYVAQKVFTKNGKDHHLCGVGYTALTQHTSFGNAVYFKMLVSNHDWQLFCFQNTVAIVNFFPWPTGKLGNGWQLPLATWLRNSVDFTVLLKL